MKKHLVLKTATNICRSVGVVGQGGTGTVYKVLDEDSETFAAKCLDPSKATRIRRKRFKNELLFGSTTEHQHIVRVLDSGVALVDGADRPFFVMPLYPKSFRTMLSEEIPDSKKLNYFRMILDGVEAAHRLRTVHRDLKPENILFDPVQDRLLVADFGIARFTEDELYTLVETTGSERLASWHYAAPEQKRRGKAVDRRADIYALGLMLNEMFTGEILQGAGFKTVASVNPAFAYLDPIIEAMVQQSPDERLGSIEAIKQEIRLASREFVERQVLDEQKRKVVPVSQISDPLIEDPVRLVGAEPRGRELVFRLSQPVTSEWIEAFAGGVNFSLVTSPREHHFAGDEVAVRLLEGRMQEQVDIFKRQLEQANKHYKELVHQRKQRREMEERKQLEAERVERRKNLRRLEEAKKLVL